ncbi:MAG: hypothetical protein QXZ63_07980 [Sulfolobales archaeon]
MRPQDCAQCARGIRTYTSATTLYDSVSQAVREVTNNVVEGLESQAGV